MFETNGTFTRGLGTGAGQIQFLTNSAGDSAGVSAVGGLLTLDFGGDGAGTGPELVWGSACFNPQQFVLNDAAANSSVALTDGIDLAGANRTIAVYAQSAEILGNIITSSGTAGLIITQAGTLVLAGTNTYNGGTTIRGGNLFVSAAVNLGTGPVTLEGGTLELTSDVPVTFSNSVLIPSNSSGTIYVAQATNGTGTNQTHSMNGLTFSTGNGTLNVLGGNGYGLTFTGVTTVSGGSPTIVNLLAAPGTLTLQGGVVLGAGSVLQCFWDGVAGTGTTNINGVSGSGSLSVQGPVVLSGNNSGWTGGVSSIFDGGVLSVGAGSSLGTGNVVFAGPGLPGTLLITASSTFNNTIVFNQSYGTISVNSGVVTTWAGPLTGSNQWFKSGPGTLVLTGSNTALTAVTEVTGGVLRATGASLSPSTLVLYGGVLETGANFDRGVTITGGTSGFSAYGAAISVAIETVPNNGNPYPLVLGMSTPVSFKPSDFVLNAATANNTLTFQNAVSFGSGGNLAVNVNASSAYPATMSGILSGSGSLIKGGPGTLILSNTNSYSGGTTIQAGALSVAATGNLGAGGLTFGGTGGGILQVTGNTAFSSTAGVLLSQNGTINQDNSAGVTLSGAISGTGLLIVSGSGSLTLTGSANSFGGTMVDEGKLILTFERGPGGRFKPDRRRGRRPPLRRTAELAAPITGSGEQGAGSREQAVLGSPLPAANPDPIAETGSANVVPEPGALALALAALVAGLGLRRRREELRPKT